jgi:hypothetical protein
MEKVGYEIYHFLLDPNIKHSEKYQAFRVEKGRFVHRSAKFATEREAQAWIKSDQGRRHPDHQDEGQPSPKGPSDE